MLALFRNMLVLAVTVSTFGAASRLRDVPLGLCGICEVNCFEDCTLKFDREIIQPDLALMQVGRQGKPKTNKVGELAKKATETEIARLKAKGSKKCGKAEECKAAKTCATNMHAELKSLASIKADNEAQFKQYEEQSLEDAHQFSNSGKSWADSSALKASIHDMPEWHAPSPSALAHGRVSLSAQNASKGSLRGNLAPAPGGPNDPNEPRNYFPLHPVKIGVFEQGLINMDTCLNYCLATTCGCEGVPGMEDKSDINKVSDAGAKAGTHTVTPPQWKYRKALKEECGHGLGDNKVIKDLYVDFAPGVGGMMEICTKDFFMKSGGASAMLGLTDPAKDMEKCDCGVNRLDCHEPKYGCSWNHVKDRCEYKAMYNTICYKRYTFDRR